MDVFDEVGVRFAHEVHPSEIAYDYYSTQRDLEAIDHRAAFGINWDPSHKVWQNIDPVQFIWDFKDRIYHVDCKDTKVRCFRMLTTIGYEGPISIEWEDAGMDRLNGVPAALAYIRSQLFEPPTTAFDRFFEPGLTVDTFRRPKWVGILDSAALNQG